MEISINQQAFINQLMMVGDEKIACKKLGLDSSLVLQWLIENDDFKIKSKQAIKHYLSTVENAITRASLNALYEALQHGERVVTNTRTTREALDLEGNIQTLNTRVVKQQTNSRPAWAVKQGIQIHMLKRLEESISNSLATLINEGVIGEDISDRILAVLDKNDEQVKLIFSGNAQSVKITQEQLAEVQAMLLGT